jgi:hypothetical protein
MRFLKFTISILLICVATMVLLEFAYRNYSTQADRLFKPYFKKAATIETIYIGNSHIGVFTGLYGEDAKQVGNLSLGGQDIFRMYVALKTVVPKSPKLKTIYLGFDYDLLGYNQTKSGQEYIDREYYPYVDTLYNNTMTNRAMSMSNFFRANRDIAYLLKRNTEQVKPINYIPVASTPAPASNTTAAPVTDSAPVAATVPAPVEISRKQHNPFMCRKRAEEHTLLKYKQKNIAENLICLHNIIQLCRQHNIKLVLFDPPKTECYRFYSNPEVVVNAKHSIDSFAAANHVPYLDFYADSAFNDDMFVDFDHLNQVGVKILDDKLISYQ